MLKRLDFHKFGYEIAQGDDERAADIYIAGKILSIFDKNDSDIESLKSVIKEVDIQFGTWEATKVDLKGYNYWTWKIPDYTQNAAFRLLKNKNEILCSQYYTSTEWKGPVNFSFKNFFSINQANFWIFQESNQTKKSLLMSNRFQISTLLQTTATTEDYTRFQLQT